MSEFVFQWPAAFSLMVLLPLMGWLLAYARKQRLRLIAAMGGGMTTHRRLRDMLRLIGLALLILALARPGYDPRMESSSRSGRDVVFALDVSQSMLAQDIAPSRLEVAKQAIRDALATYQNQRVGLVVYAGSASILCPLTYDYDFVRFMLEQAHPRSVDFGGTTLQSAVEKIVDQVFMEGRGGVQDLIVLTDGGDHGSQMAKVAELLQEQDVDVLVIGLGDPNRGATIPVLDQEGNAVRLEDEGQVVYTKLDDAALKNFATQSSRTVYEPIGTRPFNLGEVYADYAADKAVKSADSESGVIVYHEAAFFFLIPALILLILSECWGARGLQLATAVFAASCLLPISDLEAASQTFRDDFNSSISLMKSGSYEEAEQQLNTLYREANARSARPGDLATVQLNRGLCLLKLSEAQSAQNPGLAMRLAQDAQVAFLSAKRYAPELKRVGVRLQSTSDWVAQLASIIETQQMAEDEINQAIQQLIERLQALLEAEQKLRELSLAEDVDRRHPRRAKGAPPPPPIVAPASAPGNALKFVQTQTELFEEGKSIKSFMQVIDAMLAPPELAEIDPDTPTMDSLMKEPIELMDRALTAQEAATRYLADWNSWPAARSEIDRAERAILRILELIAGNANQQSEDSDDWEEYDEEYDYEYMDDSEQTMSSSEPIEGDLAAGSDMQELPVPNYSAEDILLEEQGNLQFRQQKRASAKAGQVEKDY